MEILQHQWSSVYIQFVRHPPNHSSCLDIPSNSFFMILPSTYTLPVVTSTPRHPTWRYLTTVLECNKLWCHLHTVWSCHRHIPQHLCLSVTWTSLTTFPQPAPLPLVTQCYDRIPPLRLEVFWKYFPIILVSWGIIDGTPPPLDTHQWTSLVFTWQNYILVIKYSTPTSQVTFEYPQHWILDTLLHCQLLLQQSEQLVAQQWVQHPCDRKGRQVAPHELVMMLGVPPHKYIRIHDKQL